jgi:putative ABC transport system substrate-binding protein
MAVFARRQFLIAAGGLLAVPLARPQTGRVHRVVMVATETPEARAVRVAFVDAMRGLGYVQGRNLVFDELGTRQDASDLPAVVDEALARKPDVLLAWESIALALRARTSTIPIVLTGSIDPVKAGLAQSLSRPGLNATGFSQLHDQLPAKHMELLREILPRLKRVGQLVDLNAGGCRIAQAHSVKAARGIGCDLLPYYVSNRAEIERAFAQMERDPPDALLPCPTPVLYAFRELLFENVLRLRIPLTSYIVNNVPRGVLFAYAASVADIYRRAATVVDKILRGTNPGDIPIEQPTNLELVVNLGTAKALGLSVPRSVLLRADRVVE